MVGHLGGSRAQQLERYAAVRSFYRVFTRVYHLLKKTFHLLAGSIPTEFGELINLTELYLHFNSLTGAPPFARFTLVCIRVYHLLKNTFHLRSGEIPRELCQCVKLSAVNLYNNQLAGTFLQNNAFRDGTRVLPLFTENTFHLRWQGQSPPKSAS